MYYSLSLKYMFIASFLLALQSCTSNPSDSFSSHNGTFEKEQINAETGTLNTRENLLLAGTTEGAFKKQLEGNTTWHKVGLQIDSSQVVDFVIENSSYYMAAIAYDETANGRAVLFETKNGGDSWNEISVTYDEESMRFFAVKDLETNSTASDKIFADNSGYIIESTDGGRSWSKIFTSGMTHFLYQPTFHSQQLWSGGQTNIFSPHLAKSEDGGQNWALLNENFFTDYNTETIVRDAILHRENSDHVLVGAGGGIAPANVIRKSTDGGKTWETVLEGINTRTFTHSADNPEWVYASGRNADGSLFFVASGDFGESWETIEWDDSPAGVQVNDMVSVMEEGQEVLYFGTNQGVFSYRFTE